VIFKDLWDKEGIGNLLLVWMTYFYKGVLRRERMTAADQITGDLLYNPHVQIIREGGEKKFYAHINAATFAPCHRHLISPIDDRSRIKAGLENLYQVWAVVSLQDHALDWEEREQWTRGLRVGGPVLSETLMGYVTEKDLTKHLPKLLGKAGTRRKRGR
jgi:hypothetical protein